MTGTERVGLAVLALAFVMVVLVIRWALTPIRVLARAGGRHRTQRAGALSDGLLDDLLGPWPAPAHGAVVTQAWRWCPSCCRNEPSVLHADGCWTCGHCFETTTHATTGSAL